MAGEWDWLRDSLNGIREDIKDVRSSVGRVYDKLDAHEKECPARRTFFKKPSEHPAGNQNLLTWIFKIGPFILAAALGLIGLGAYWGGNNNIIKLEKEIANLQKAINSKVE